MTRISVFFTILMFTAMSCLFCNCNTNESAESFETYRYICYDNIHNEYLRHNAAVEMTKTAKSFDEWSAVRTCSSLNSDLETIAVRHMAEISIKSRDTNDMREAAVDTQCANQMELNAEIIIVMLDVANKSNNFNDWLNVSVATKYTNTFTFLVALDKMIQTATGADDWVWMYKMAPKENSCYRQFALLELGRLTPSFDNWRNIANETWLEENKTSQATFKMALDKMFQTAKDYYDWYWVCRWSPDGSEMQKFAFKKMAELK